MEVIPGKNVLPEPLNKIDELPTSLKSINKNVDSLRPDASKDKLKAICDWTDPDDTSYKIKCRKPNVVKKSSEKNKILEHCLAVSSNSCNLCSHGSKKSKYQINLIKVFQELKTILKSLLYQIAPILNENLQDAVVDPSTERVLELTFMLDACSGHQVFTLLNSFIKDISKDMKVYLFSLVDDHIEFIKAIGKCYCWFMAMAEFEQPIFENRIIKHLTNVGMNWSTFNMHRFCTNIYMDKDVQKHMKLAEKCVKDTEEGQSILNCMKVLKRTMKFAIGVMEGYQFSLCIKNNGSSSNEKPAITAKEEAKPPKMHLVAVKKRSKRSKKAIKKESEYSLSDADMLSFDIPNKYKSRIGVLVRNELAKREKARREEAAIENGSSIDKKSSSSNSIENITNKIQDIAISVNETEKYKKSSSQALAAVHKTPINKSKQTNNSADESESGSQSSGCSHHKTQDSPSSGSFSSDYDADQSLSDIDSDYKDKIMDTEGQNMLGTNSSDLKMLSNHDLKNMIRHKHRIVLAQDDSNDECDSDLCQDDLDDDDEDDEDDIDDLDHFDDLDDLEDLDDIELLDDIEIIQDFDDLQDLDDTEELEEQEGAHGDHDDDDTDDLPDDDDDDDDDISDDDTTASDNDEDHHCDCCVCHMMHTNQIGGRQNYNMRRDRLRQVLSKKKSNTNNESENPPTPEDLIETTAASAQPLPDIDELVGFIEAESTDDKQNKNAKKRSKKNRQKQKKKNLNKPEQSDSPNDISLESPTSKTDNSFMSPQSKKEEISKKAEESRNIISETKTSVNINEKVEIRKSVNFNDLTSDAKIDAAVRGELDPNLLNKTQRKKYKKIRKQIQEDKKKELAQKEDTNKILDKVLSIYESKVGNNRVSTMDQSRLSAVDIKNDNICKDSTFLDNEKVLDNFGLAADLVERKEKYKKEDSKSTSKRNIPAFPFRNNSNVSDKELQKNVLNDVFSVTNYTSTVAPYIKEIYADRPGGNKEFYELIRRDKKLLNEKFTKGGLTSDIEVFTPKKECPQGDKDIEEFKRFCFFNRNAGNKPKVNLNVKDIFNKNKQPSAKN